MAKTKNKQIQKTTPTPSPKKKEVKETFALGMENYILMIIGIVIMVIGYILMAGKENIFSFGNTSLPVIIIMFGFLFELYAILKKPKSQSKNE
jgi:cytochrome b561